MAEIDPRVLSAYPDLRVIPRIELDGRVSHLESKPLAPKVIWEGPFHGARVVGYSIYLDGSLVQEAKVTSEPMWKDDFFHLNFSDVFFWYGGSPAYTVSQIDEACNEVQLVQRSLF